VLDGRNSVCYEATSESVTGIVKVLQLGEAMRGRAGVNRSRLQSNWLRQAGERPFCSLEHPDQVAACQVLFKHLVGDHRREFPSAGGEASKAKLVQAGHPWFPDVPYKPFGEHSEGSLQTLFDAMLPKAVIDIEDLHSAVHACCRLTRASRANVQAAIQTKLRELRVQVPEQGGPQVPPTLATNAQALRDGGVMHSMPKFLAKLILSSGGGIVVCARFLCVNAESEGSEDKHCECCFVYCTWPCGLDVTNVTLQCRLLHQCRL
jgi:hypothetical protein